MAMIVTSRKHWVCTSVRMKAFPSICIALIIIISELRRAIPNSLPSPDWRDHSQAYVLVVAALYGLAFCFIGSIAISQPYYIWREWKAATLTRAGAVAALVMYVGLVATFFLFDRFGHLFPPKFP